MKNKRGRPKASNPRNYRLPDIRLTKEEYQVVLLRSILFSNSRVSSYIRELIQQDQRTIKPVESCPCGSRNVELYYGEEWLTQTVGSNTKHIKLANFPKSKCLNCGEILEFEMMKPHLLTAIDRIIEDQIRNGIKLQRLDVHQLSSIPKRTQHSVVLEDVLAVYSNEAVFIIDDNGGIKPCNLKAETITGYSKKELCSMTCDELFDTYQGLATKQDQVSAFNLLEEASEYEGVLMNKNKELIDIRVKYFKNEHYERGLSWFVVMDDMSFMNRNFQLLYKSSNDAAIFLDKRCCVRDLNETAKVMFGAGSAAEFNRKHVVDFMGIIDHEIFESISHRVMKGEALSVTMLTKHFSYLTINLTPVFYQTEVYGVYVLLNLAENIAPFNNIHFPLPVFISKVISDQEVGPFVTVNQQACKKLGYKYEELVQMHEKDITMIHKPRLLLEQLKRLLKEGDISYFSNHIAKNNQILRAKIYSYTRSINEELYVISIALYFPATSMDQVPLDSSDPGKRLRMVMAELDINTSELANQSGISLTTISNLRTSKIIRPKKQTAITLSRILGVEAHYLWPDVGF